MSRIGKSPIPVPSGVTVTINGADVKVKGPKGELSRTLRSEISIKQEDGKIETFSATQPFTPAAAQLAEFAGVYSSSEIDPLYEIKVEYQHTLGGESGHPDQLGLVLFRLKNDPDMLRPIAHDFFAASVGKIRFTRDAKGNIDGFLLSTGRVVNLRFNRGRPAIAAK